MTATLQLEETIKQPALHEAPKLLVEWSPRWGEFKTAIAPALARSEARLAGEAPYGITPYWGMIPTWLVEAFLIFVAIVLPGKLAQLRPYVAPKISSHEIIYYSGDELPRTEDLGGAQAGRTGRAGGQEAHHRTQTIRIARGGSLTERVVDAPNLKLPSSKDAVANLLAIKPDAGPPPSEGLASTRTRLTLPTQLVAPAPNVIRDYTRNGVKLDEVIPPSPTLQKDPFRAAPNLSATVIPPAPGVANDHTLVAPSLAPTVIAPAPRVSRDRASAAPTLSPTVVAPAPSVSSDKTRSVPSLAANVIPPAPGAVSREIASSPVQMTNVTVVPPPVSAPERTSSRASKLNIPAPSVVAPPPSADISQDMRRLPSGSVPDPSKTVVPPPPTQSGSGSMLSSLMGKIFGASEVVPPPPSVNAGSSTGNGSSLAPNVVPPPPSVAVNSGASSRSGRNGGPTLGSNVIAPPPSAGVSGGSGNRPVSASTAPALGVPNVVPPPPSLTGAGGGSGDSGGGKGAPGGTLLANNVVPPPPSISNGSGAAGSGSGRKGPGLGAPMDVGAPTAPTATGGSGTNAGAVISSQPGSKVGLPTSGGKGELAMSPTGGDKPGLGSTGGGAGIAHGNGPGSGMTGDNSGAGKAGTGHGSDPNARGGISPNPGTGGAGNAPSGNPGVVGVSVEGGTTAVTLPSFGADAAGGGDPALPGKSSAGKHRDTLGVTIVATATSGGAFEPYKTLLHGEKYTTYLDTPAGTVVVEFADGSTSNRAAMIAPYGIRTDLPALPHVRMVVTGTIDASGNIRNLRALEPGPADATAKLIAALRAWKVQPAMRGDQPVGVTAILGFNIDTNDRF